jgi:L-alanine-DL-glutamate epimerase-like enolase superfamily enzyme
VDQTIASVKIIDVKTRYPRTIGRNAVLGAHGSGPTVRAVILRTTEGATGWGVLCRNPPDPQHLVGWNVARLFDPALGVVEPSALWADVALHDLAGVLLGQPVYRLVGGRGVRRVPVYDASIYFDDLDPPHDPRGIEAILAEVQDGWNEGYRAFKLKIGRGCTWMAEAEGLERDVEVTHAVRAAFPPARLFVDGNNGFTVEGVLRYLDRVRDVGLVWVEEPFHEHRAGLVQVRAWIDANSPRTLIADGEYQPVIDEVVRYARDGLIDVLLMDVLDYGLTPWRRLATALEESGVRYSPHAWGLPLKTLYAAHLAAGLPGVMVVEAVRGETVGVDTSGYTVVEGALTVPDTPGFGLPPPALSPP